MILKARILGQEKVHKLENCIYVKTQKAGEDGVLPWVIRGEKDFQTFVTVTGYHCKASSTPIPTVRERPGKKRERGKNEGFDHFLDPPLFSAPVPSGQPVGVQRLQERTS